MTVTSLVAVIAPQTGESPKMTLEGEICYKMVYYTLCLDKMRHYGNSTSCNNFFFIEHDFINDISSVC